MRDFLHPKAVHLLLFAVVLGVLLYSPISESLFNLFSSVGVFLLLLCAGAFLFLAVIIDASFKTATHRYAIAAIIVVAVTNFIAVANTGSKQEQTEKLGYELAEQIKLYKKRHGRFPDNFNEGFFDRAPKKTAFGNLFIYRKLHDKNGQEIFELSFSGLSGMDAYLISSRMEWHYDD